MRRLLKQSLARAASWIPGSVVHGVFGSFCPIFMLHRFAEGATRGHDILHVERCLSHLRRHRFQPISLTVLTRLLLDRETLPAKAVCFTIDDGFEDHARIGGELFARYDVPLTCFVITDFLDRISWPWDDQVAYAVDRAPAGRLHVTLPDQRPFELALGRDQDRSPAIEALQDALKDGPQDEIYAWMPELFRAADVEAPTQPPRGYLPMTWDDARAFVRHGHCIAPHTGSHRILSRLGDAQSRAEIERSVLRMKQELAEPPRVFAYPTGRLQDFGAREQALLAGFGIEGAVSTEPRTCTPADGLLALPRYSLPADFADFVQYLSFVEVLKERLRSLRATR